MNILDNLRMQSHQRQLDNLIEEVVDLKHVLEKAIMGLNAASQQIERATQMIEMQKELEYIEKKNSH